MTAPEEGGDAACWLDRVCDACGAFVDEGEEHRCPAPAPTEGGDDT